VNIKNSVLYRKNSPFYQFDNSNIGSNFRYYPGFEKELAEK